MSVVNSQEAWALAIPKRRSAARPRARAHARPHAPSRESPFDGAHSQNTAAENPPLNRRFNVVQRAFIPTDRSLLKPSATNPPADNDNTLLEVPDYSFLHCVFGGPANWECQTLGPGTVSATAPVAATLSFVMSGTTRTTRALPGPAVTGTAQGTSVVESYFASNVPQTTAATACTGSSSAPRRRGPVEPGRPGEFQHSEHGQAPGHPTRASSPSRCRSRRTRTASSSGRARRAAPGRCCSTRATALPRPS